MKAVAKHLVQLVGALALACTPAFPATFLANTYGAKGDGTTLDTAAIQKAIDAASPKKGTVTFKPGTYLTGAIFLKSGVTLDIPEGVTLTGSQDIKDFPELPTRIAGIEMTWPAAMINTRDAHDVTITGKGTIDQNGAVWWKVFSDTLKIYQPKGLRWAPTTTPSASASCSSRAPPTSISAAASPSSAPASGPSRSCTRTT